MTTDAGDRLTAAREALARSQPFADALGVEILEASTDEVRARMAYRPELCRFNGTLHGGAIASFADAVGVVCAALNAQGELAGTLELKVNYFRPVADGHVDAAARVLHSGRTSLVMATEITDAEGRRVAFVTQTQAIRS